MSERRDIIRIAAAEVGYTAGEGDATKYGAWYGMDHNPWCMMFVSWCADRAGVKTDVIPRMAYCPYAVTWFRSRGRFVKAGAGRPEPGDVIFFTEDGVTAEHVGLVEKTEGARVYTIEGNSGNSVRRRSYMLSDSYLLGWGRPAYDEAKEEQMEIRDIDVYLVDSKSRVRVKGCVEQGVTYIKLRDAEKLFPVSVGWDPAAKVATLALNYRQ